MIGLDVGALSPEIARLLLLRGAGLPPVLWCSDAHRTAKKTLDTLDDAALFATQIVNDQMAAATRALLYLWTGWNGDSLMFCQGAAAQEQHYIAGLCERHSKHFAEAKAFLKQVGRHPVHEELINYVLATTTNAPDLSVRRIREMLELDRRWEPFLFCDAIAQAAAGKLKSVSENGIRQIQAREFELLLSWCYEQAIGTKINQRVRVEVSEGERKAAERERRLRAERRKKDESRRREEFAARHAKQEQPAGATAAAATKPSEQTVGVSCPKCGHPRQLPEAARGKMTTCAKCGVSFQVPTAGAAPARGPSAAPANASTGVIAVLCPKCSKKLVLPATARGKKIKCLHCEVTFMVPQPQPVGAG